MKPLGLFSFVLFIFAAAGLVLLRRRWRGLADLENAEEILRREFDDLGKGGKQW